MVKNATIVAEEINATVVDMRFVKPLDEDLIKQLSATHNQIITLEENAIAGGAGSSVNEFLAENKILISITNLGIQDEFIEHGDPDDLIKLCGLDVESIKRKIENLK